MSDLSSWKTYILGLSAESSITNQSAWTNNSASGGVGGLLTTYGDGLDTNNDGIIVVDFAISGQDFSVNNTDWVINGSGNKLIIFRLRNGSNLLISNGSILLGTGGIANSDLGVIFFSGYEGGSSSDTVFNFNNVVANGVAFWDLNAVGEGGSSINTEIVINNGQGCAQFISQKVNFQNNRWNRCAPSAAQGAIGDRVWYDLDGQGDQDGGEVGINGVTVHLYSGVCGPNGSPIQTKTTSDNGNYLFTALPAGDYCVALDTATLPAPGYIQTNSGTVSNPQSVTLTTGQSRLDVDFGYMANQCLPTIDFETDAAGNPLVKGQVIDNEWAAWGITVAATANAGGTGPAMIFDSANPTGGDTDLGTPNQSFGGPGVGGGGAAGMPGANAVALGKVLIISENGSSSNPDDNANGGVIKFTFSQPLRVDQVQILDIDDHEAGGTVKAYDATSGGNLLATGAMLGLGDNSFQIVPLNATGVRRLEVTFPQSGAVPAITFCGTPPVLYTLGDRIWNDTNEDGDQDSGESGIGNVKMIRRK